MDILLSFVSINKSRSGCGRGELGCLCLSSVALPDPVSPHRSGPPALLLPACWGVAVPDGHGRLAPAADTQLFPGHLQEHSLTVPFIWNSMAHVTSSFQGLSAPCLCCGNYRLTHRDCPSVSHWISTLNPGAGCGSCRAGQDKTKISVGLTQCHPTQCTPCYSLAGNIYDHP